MIIKFDWERFESTANRHGDKTLEDMSARSGIDVSVLSRLSNYQRRPSLTTAVLAAIAYGDPLDSLITVSGRTLNGYMTAKEAA